MEGHMSLNDVVRFLVLFLHRERLDLHFQDRKPWHALFYDLKRLPSTTGVPLAIRDAFFGWNGPAPACQDLDECLDGLFRAGSVEWSLPGLRTYRLSESGLASWAGEFDQLKGPEKDFLSRVALAYARQRFTAVVA
jgi:hypothetical protein